MVTFATANANGTLTERLGIGLQNRVRRFESARYLQRKIDPKGPIFFWRYLEDIPLNTTAPAYDNVSPCVLLIRRKDSSCTQ